MQSLTAIDLVASGLTSTLSPSRTPAPHLDLIMLGNFLLVGLALLCFSELRYSRKWLLVFGFCTAGLSLLGFLRGAIALGTIVGLWSFVTFQHYWRNKNARSFNAPMAGAAVSARYSWKLESRLSRLFGAKPSDSWQMGE